MNKLLRKQSNRSRQRVRILFSDLMAAKPFKIKGMSCIDVEAMKIFDSSKKFKVRATLKDVARYHPKTGKDGQEYVLLFAWKILRITALLLALLIL